jgi:hypothetical protein
MSALGGYCRSIGQPIAPPAVSSTAELRRGSLCILPDLCKTAKNKNAVSHKVLGKHKTFSTGCTGVLIFGFSRTKAKNTKVATFDTN